MPLNPFNDVSRNNLPIPDNVAGFDDMRRISALEVGTGSRAFKSDDDGIWLGANKFADATFSVGMDGSATLKSATFKNDSGTTFIDGDGIISSVNFNNAVSTAGSSMLTSGSGNVTLLSTDYTVSRNTLLAVFFDINFIASGNAVTTDAKFETKKDSGTWNQISYGVCNMTTPGNGESTGFHYVYNAPTGKHYFRVIVSASGAGTAVTSGRLSCLVLGS